VVLKPLCKHFAHQSVLKRRPSKHRKSSFNYVETVTGSADNLNLEPQAGPI